MSPKMRAVFVKELRDSLRDRRTIFASVVVPLLLYPIMLLGMAEVSQIARAKLDRETYTVAIPEGSRPFFEKISERASGDAETEHAKAPPIPIPSNPQMDALKNPPAPPLQFVEMTAVEAERRLIDGEVRAVVVMPADFTDQLQQNLPVNIQIKFDQAEHRSRDAFQRIETLFENYQRSVVSERLRAQNLSRAFLEPFKLTSVNIAQPKKVGGSFIGMFLPLIFIMMIITGAIHPAIDMTAGEKERSTLETLIGSPVRPIEVIGGKFLAVATLALGNAALNVGSFGLTFSVMPMPQQGGFQFPWEALPATLLLLAPLTLFFAALLLAVASFAANQKEAQIYCLPIYLVPVLGMMVVTMPGIELEGPLLLIPVVNTALLIKELFLGHGNGQQIAFVFCSTCLYAAGAVAVAARVFAREEVLFSTQASFRIFLNRRFFRPADLPKPGDSLLVLALLFPLNFYFQTGLAKSMVDLSSRAIPIDALTLLVLLPQFLLFLGLPLLVAWYLKLDLRKTFLWKRPSLSDAFAGVCLGCGSWIVAQQIIAWQSALWPAAVGQEDVLSNSLKTLLDGSSGGIALLIALIGVTPALCEEHLFRGFLQQGLRKSGKWVVLIVVGVIFGAYHVRLYNQPVLMLGGVALAYVAYQTRSIWPGVIFHFLHNSLSLLGPALLESLFGAKFLEPSGTRYPDVPLNILGPAAALMLLGILLVRHSRAGTPSTSGVQAAAAPAP